MTGWIGISLGDITGIGPEVTLKALAVEAQADDTRYLLIGDAEHTRRLNEQLGLKLPLQTYTGKDSPGGSSCASRCRTLCRRTCWKARPPPRARQSPGCGKAPSAVCVTSSMRW